MLGQSAQSAELHHYVLEAQDVALGALKLRQLSARLSVHVADASAVVSESPMLKTLLAGGSAGAVSRTLTAPLDRLKVLVQEGRVVQHLAQQQSQHHYGPRCGAIRPNVGLRDVCAHVYHTGGVAAFWRGNGVNCLKAGPEQAAAFTARQFYLSSVCADVSNPTFAENCMVGGLAGLSAQALLYPMEVVKTRMAVAEAREYSGIFDCFKQSVRRGGVRDLYVGLFANAVGILPHRGLEMGTFFTLDRAARRSYRGPDKVSPGVPPVWVTMSISFVASLLSQLVTYPLNLVRTKLQTQGVNGRPVVYRGMGHCFYSVVHESGVRGLFAGIVPNMMKAIPASMLMYMTFSYVSNTLDAYSGKRQ